MLNFPNTTTYSASFPPPVSKKKLAEKNIRLPVIVPVGFASYFLFANHRLKRGPPLSDRIRDAQRSISLGFNTPREFRTIHWSVEKPIVRSLPPQDIPTVTPATAAPQDRECSGDVVANSESVQSIDERDAVDWDELAVKRRYTSVTANAAEERALHLPPPPRILPTTCESDCDPVRWKKSSVPRQPISIAWDRTQARVMDGITVSNKTQTSL